MTVTLHSDSDKEISKGFKSGDKEAFASLYELYSPALFGILKKLTGTDEKAELGLQLCFVKVWRDKNQYDPAKEKLLTWLLDITRHVAKNLREDDKRGAENLSNTISVSVKSPEFIGEKAALIKELIIFDGISQVEIFQKTGVSVNEQRQILREELNKFRAILEK